MLASFEPFSWVALTARFKQNTCKNRQKPCKNHRKPRFPSRKCRRLRCFQAFQGSIWKPKGQPFVLREHELMDVQQFRGRQARGGLTLTPTDPKALECASVIAAAPVGGAPIKLATASCTAGSSSYSASTLLNSTGDRPYFSRGSDNCPRRGRAPPNLPGLHLGAALADLGETSGRRGAASAPSFCAGALPNAPGFAHAVLHVPRGERAGIRIRCESASCRKSIYCA